MSTRLEQRVFSLVAILGFVTSYISTFSSVFVNLLCEVNNMATNFSSFMTFDAQLCFIEEIHPRLE